MPNPNNWPVSDSEHILKPWEAEQVVRHVITGQCNDPKCRFAMLANNHNAAVYALVELRCVAEKYYEAAGFRD